MITLLLLITISHAVQNLIAVSTVCVHTHSALNLSQFQIFVDWRRSAGSGTS